MVAALISDIRFNTRLKVAASHSLLSFIIAGALLIMGPAAVDQAAHSHLQQIFDARAFGLWDNSWYLGRYAFVNYSFAFYLIAFLVGIKLLAVLSVSVSVGLISVLADRCFPGALEGKRRASLLVLPLMVLTGAWPFLLGAAFLLVGMFLYLGKMKLPFTIVATLVLLSSPLAFLGLLLMVFAAEVPFDLLLSARSVGWFVKTSLSSFYLWVVAILAVLQFLSIRAFPDHGRYPFAFSDLVIVEVFVLVCLILVPGGKAYSGKLRALIVLYGLTNVVSFMVRSNLGSNSTRIIDFAFPVIVGILGLRWPRANALSLLLVPALVWNFMPLSQLMSTSIYTTSGPDFWKQLGPSLSKYLVPGSRVELVDTANHQGAFYLPQMGFTIVRGWFRQDDFPQNDLLYKSTQLSSTAYLNWLTDSGASLVLLPPGPYDSSSVAEARLLDSGRSGLKLVSVVGKSKIFRVPGAPTVIRSPQGRFIPAHIGSDLLTFVAPVAGTYRLSMFYSPYFRMRGALVCTNPEGMVTLKIINPGSRRLVFDLSLGKVLSVLIGNGNNGCS